MSVQIHTTERECSVQPNVDIVATVFQDIMWIYNGGVPVVQTVCGAVFPSIQCGWLL